MNPVDLLRHMLEIESLSGHEEELAVFLVDRMGELGFDACIDGVGNAVGLRRGPNAADGSCQEIVLLGHMDTVPGHVAVRASGDRLYGRGAVDAKGPLAAFVAAAAQVEPPPGVRITVIGAVEEEAATSKGARHVVEQYRPAACIIGEPSGWDAVTLGYKGRLLVDYRLEQPAGHTAGPGGAAAEVAVAWWQALKAYTAEFNQSRQRMFDQLLPSLRRIQTTGDGLTDVVEATVAFRLPPNFDVAALEATARRHAGSALVRCYSQEPAFRASRNTPLVRAFLRAIRGAGGQPRFKLKTGTSDMNVVGPVWGCPIVAYGPGDSRLDHTPEEHVSIAEYLRAIDVLGEVLRLWAFEPNSRELGGNSGN